MKRNYDARLRRQRESIKAGDFVFLRFERRDEAESRHKLAAVGEGPYKVESVKGNTVVIEYPDAKVEIVSRDRVTLAPETLDEKAVAKLLAPITDQEIVPANFPVHQDVDLHDVVTPRCAESPVSTHHDTDEIEEPSLDSPRNQVRAARSRTTQEAPATQVPYANVRAKRPNSNSSDDDAYQHQPKWTVHLANSKPRASTTPAASRIGRMSPINSRVTSAQQHWTRKQIRSFNAWT